MRDDANDLSFEERHLWVGTILGTLAVAIYSVIVGIRLSDSAPSEVAWGMPMLWTVSIAAAAYGAAYLVMWQRTGGQRTDARDLEISRFGELTAKGLLDFAVLVTLVMLALGAEIFWVAQVLFFGSYFSSLTGSLVKLSAHRKGLPS